MTDFELIVIGAVNVVYLERQVLLSPLRLTPRNLSVIANFTLTPLAAQNKK